MPVFGIPEYFRKDTDQDLTLISFADTVFDEDVNEGQKVADDVQIDMRKKGALPSIRNDPLEVFKFNDPLFSRQWHLVHKLGDLLENINCSLIGSKLVMT